MYLPRYLALYHKKWHYANNNVIFFGKFTKVYVAVVSDNDGSAFITKAEFDSLKNNFQAQIDNYNQSIDSKIDGAIAAYLSGIKIETGEEHLEVDWITDFMDDTLGIVNCKYVDIYHGCLRHSMGRKSELFYFTRLPSGGDTFFLADAYMQISNDITMNDSTSTVNRVNTMGLGGSHTHPIIIPDFSGTNGPYGLLTAPDSAGYFNVQRSNFSSGWAAASLTYKGDNYNTAWSGWNAVTNIGYNFNVRDERWSDLAGFPIIVYRIRDCDRETNEKQALFWPVLVATDGSGEVSFKYYPWTNHPYRSLYGCLSYSDTGGSLMASYSKVCFAVLDLTSGAIVEYLTPEDGNVLLDTGFTIDTFKTVSAHMRANQALVVCINTKYVNTSYGTRTYAFRLKMNFQNLNP